MPLHRRLALAAGACLGVSAAAPAQTPCGSPVGPDVIVGDTQDVAYYGAVGPIGAYSFGTISCNVGNANVAWVSSTNRHPVISQAMHRIKDGRFEQLGVSWLKHGFTALTGSICCTCSGVGGSQLGVGCSDPYTAGRNGSQSNCGPRYQVNPNNGYFTYPFPPSCDGCPPPTAPATIGRRLQVAAADVDPAQHGGAVYFVEIGYVAADDARAGNGLNNYSCRRVQFPAAGAAPTFVAPTVRQKTAVEAWRDLDPTVTLVKAEYVERNQSPDTGAITDLTARFWVAAKVTPIAPGDRYLYTYVVMNVNSDRAALAFTVPVGCRATVTGASFHGVPFHSGEPIDNTDWVAGALPHAITWRGTQTFAQNPYANALHWGTAYTFSFTADGPPTPDKAVIEFFKPPLGAGPASLTVPGLPVPGPRPAAPISSPPVPEDIASFISAWSLSLQTGSLEADYDCSGSVDPADVALFVRCWIGAATGSPC